jgi:hypothetical protein
MCAHIVRISDMKITEAGTTAATMLYYIFI